MSETKQEGAECGKKSTLVLVVDDDAHILELVDSILRDGGHRTRQASTIADATNILREDEDEFDLAILDIYLPDGTGLELAAKIKSSNPKLPVVIMTGAPDSSNVRQSVDTEVDAYLIKPINVENLLSLVEELT